MQFFRNLRVKYKLLLSYSVVFIAAVSLFTYAIYSNVRKGMEENAENGLSHATSTVLSMVKTSAALSIRNHLRAVAEKNWEIANYYYFRYLKGTISEEDAKSLVREILLSQSIGKTGYIFVWDIRNAPDSIPLTVHPLIEGQDVAGVDFVQQAAMTKTGYMEYKWKNPGDDAARDKSMYLTYFEPWGWLIAASSYRDEFKELVHVDDFRSSIVSLRFGKSGYAYVIDSQGNIIVHPDLKGNLYHAHDAAGRPFIQNMCARKSGKIIYSWIDPRGNGSFRERVAIFDYIPEYDWIVVSTAYFDEVYAPLQTVKKIIFFIVITTVLLVLAVSFWIGSYITSPLLELMKRFAWGASGDFSVRMEPHSHDEVGHLAGYFNTFMERLEAQVLERKQAEEAVHESEKTYRRFLELSPEAIFVHSDGKIILANTAATQLFGYSTPTQILGKPVLHFVHPDYRQIARERIRTITEEHRGVPFMEQKYVRLDGTEIYVEATAVPFTYKGQLAVQSIARDITERKKVETDLRASEERYRAVVEDQTDLVARISPDEKLTFVNEAFCRYFGQRCEELLGRSFWAQVQEEDRPRLEEHFSCLNRENPVAMIEHRVVLPDQGVRWLQWINHALYDESGHILDIQCVGRDITDRKLAEEALRRAEENYRNIFEHAIEGIFQATPEGSYVRANPALARIYGYASPEELMRNINDIGKQLYVDPSRRQELVRIMQDQGMVSNFEFQIHRKDGTLRWASMNARAVHGETGTILYYEGTIEDITDRQNLENHLRQAQKMEAIGTLAGGIAHDFNNILAGILGHTEMAIFESPKNDSIRPHLEGILKASHRAKELVKQILAISRQGEQERKPVGVAPIAEEAMKLLRASIPTTVEIRQNIATSSRIVGDPIQIHQVIMNLCTNAHHAMRTKGGTMEVTLKDVDLKRDGTPRSPELPAGPYVKLTVSDTGHGMDDATMRRIFDPYFTTKGPGEGSGLGLAVVHGIVKSHGGAIAVQSRPDRGTVISVFLPKTEARAVDKKEASTAIPKGSENVLLVDDEKTIIDLGKKMLQCLGYKVTSMNSSLEALDLFRSKPNDFHLVITDQTMPHMTGELLASELLRIRPDLPIILCTGFSELITEEEARKIGIREFVLKPFAMSDLARTVRRTLDEV